jgi:hypothetical protein
MKDTTNPDPYDLGWSAGYHDELPDCPFPAGSVEAEEWLEGYIERRFSIAVEGQLVAAGALIRHY